MSALRRFTFRCSSQRNHKVVFVSSHPADFPYLRTDAKACLIGEATHLPYYHENYASLEEAEFVMVLGKQEADLPELLINLAPELCKKERDPELDELVLKMHQLTPPDEQSVLWQRYYHALAQTTPDAHSVFMRMAENKGLIQRQFTPIKLVPTNHFKVGTGTVVNWTDPPRGHNYVGYIK